MNAGAEMTESERGVAGTASGFPISDPNALSSSLSSPRKLPRRLRRRLLESNKSPSTTAEDIEAKLKEADLRRQQFYEFLSSKARPKPRSSSWSDSQEENLGLRLEAKFQAAEQKRLSLLAKVQKRLARLDELRQVAKSGAEMRYEKERDELGIKVKSRVQQAETNRMLLLRVHRQQRAEKREKRAQSLRLRLIQQSKYKESVRAAIYQKHAAAEKKRLELLESEKSRARERVLRVQRIANSVFNQREIERRRLKDQLEDRLEKAKRLREEYLKQRGGLLGNSETMVEQGEILSKKLARCWRCFVSLKGTTLALAKAYMALKIDTKSVKLMPFEQLALQIESTTSLKTTKALLDRLECRITFKRAALGAISLSGLENIDHLLKRVASPYRRGSVNNASRRGEKKVGSIRGARGQVKLARYPVRVVLCAYMIFGHPEAVFTGKGEHEIALSEAAESFIHEFELLIKIILDGPIRSTEEENSASVNLLNFRSQLVSFDKAWCSYLYRFVVWKVKDAKLLEEDLVRAACELEHSMMQTCKVIPEGDNVGVKHDMRVIQKQVLEDQKLLREKLQHLSGTAGLAHMEYALSCLRSRFLKTEETATPIASPSADLSSPCSSGSSDYSLAYASDERRSLVEGCDRPGSVLQSSPKADDPSPSSSGISMSSGVMFAADKEVLVNEIVHEHCSAEGLGTSYKDQESIKARVRETMERAFWDGVTETVKQDQPDYSWVIKLVKEVQDELCEMSPSSWRQEITETIDVDTLSQENVKEIWNSRQLYYLVNVGTQLTPHNTGHFAATSLKAWPMLLLKSGILDMDYFEKILEFALVTLQKLSAPAKEDEMKSSHQKLLKELREIVQGDKSDGSFAHIMMRGLRFVLQQIQMLKEEISKARITILEHSVKGPAGLEYLTKAFTNRYGSPTDAPSSLPLTVQCLSSVRVDSEQEWNEYVDSLSDLTTRDHGLPPTTLRSGGSILMAASAATPIATGLEQPECKGEKVDLLLRIGLLKLVSEVEGLTMETLPETLRLNLHRLRAVQSQLQKIIVISISILVLRQTLLAEKFVTTPVAMENILSQSIKELSDLLDRVEDVGISEIVETLLAFPEGGDPQKLKARKQVMANMLGKSLQAGDAVFSRVSRCVYLAARGLVLGGTAAKGRQLAEGALRHVGAALITQRLAEAVRILIMVASVSARVHGEWYEEVLRHA